MSAPYFVSVEYQGAPKVPHNDYAEAQTEATRLYVKYDGRKTVRILETVHTIAAIPDCFPVTAEE